MSEPPVLPNTVQSVFDSLEVMKELLAKRSDLPRQWLKDAEKGIDAIRCSPGDSRKLRQAEQALEGLKTAIQVYEELLARGKPAKSKRKSRL